MADLIRSENIPTYSIGQTVDALLKSFESQRRLYEKRWYDNNFFDDGFHFRYLSRTTGKIIDPQDKTNVNIPSRAIPKASRQIRGVANLLLLPDYKPVIYPEYIDQANYQDSNKYQALLKQNTDTAKKTGCWITEEWKNQELDEKLMLMVLLTAKQGVSYLQIWPDAIEEKMNSAVYDAFDLYLKPDIQSIYDSPAIIKGIPMLIAQIKANEMFDKEQTIKLNPDNKYASSEVKEAYIKAKMATGTTSDAAATIIQKEAFIKEYLNDHNRDQVRESLKDKFANYKDGDQVIRHIFTAGGVTLRDNYVDLPEYPFVDYRMEPGPLYPVPLIERFIPANKTLDIVVSRLERYFNTMVSGSWLVRKGENLEITNIPGGQKLEYSATPPTQAAMQNPQSAVFPFINFINSVIEEQGATTSALGQIPQGVKSGVAIESIKQTEFSNLKIPSNMLKGTIKRITERMLDLGSRYIDPQTIYNMEQGKPNYFQIIGEEGADARRKLDMPIPSNAIVIKKDYRVDIEIEQGAAFTPEGKQQTAKDLINFITPLAQAGYLSQQQVQIMIQEFLKNYQFGALQEFSDALSQGTQSSPLSDEQLQQMKVAVAETLKDAGFDQKTQQENQVMTTKVGVLEALKDSGLADKITGPIADNPELAPIPYKDAPEDIKRQMEASAGLKPSMGISPAGTDQITKTKTAMEPKPNGTKGGQNAS